MTNIYDTPMVLVAEQLIVISGSIDSKSDHRLYLEENSKQFYSGMAL